MGLLRDVTCGFIGAGIWSLLTAPSVERQYQEMYELAIREHEQMIAAYDHFSKWAFGCSYLYIPTINCIEIWNKRHGNSFMIENDDPNAISKMVKFYEKMFG